MKTKRVVFMNAPVMTAEGTFRYWKDPNGWGVSEILEDVYRGGIETLSVIGHEATAKVMSKLLNFDISMNRINYEAQEGDVMIILKMRGRIPEGTVLMNTAELEKIGYDFWIADYSPVVEKK